MADYLENQGLCAVCLPFFLLVCLFIAYYLEDEKVISCTICSFSPAKPGSFL